MVEVDTLTGKDASNIVREWATITKLIKQFGLATDAAATETDTTSVTAISILKQLSVSLQALQAAATSDPSTATGQAAIAALLADVASDTGLAAIVSALSGVATDAGLSAIVSALSGVATDAKLDAIIAKLLTAPATEAKQDALIAKLIAAPATEAKQDTLIAKDYATQTTLAAVLVALAAIDGPGSPSVDSYASVAVSAAANTANQVLVAAPGADKQIWVYGLVGTADTDAGSVSLQDEDDTALSGVMPLAANGGFAVSPSGNFAMPWLKLATNKALEIDTVTCGFKGTLTYAIVDVS